MKRKTIIKTVSIATVFLVGANFFSGCSARTVDYSVDDVTENTENRSGKKGLKQFADASAWEDEWTAVNTKGNPVTLQVNAEVFLPDAEKMSVVEVKEATIDDAFRQRVAESVFDAGSIYYYDINHLPKEDLAKLREEEQELYDSYDKTTSDPDILAYIEETEDNLKAFDEQIKEAKEEYIPAESFDVNEYLGKRENQYYSMHFWSRESDEGIVQFCGMSLNAKDIHQFCPEELKDVSDEVYCTAYSGESSTVDNQCELTEEEAKEIADRFVDDAGLDYSVCVYSTPLSWEKDLGETLDCYDGYVFYYDAGLDGISFVRPGTESDYQNYDDKKKESEPERYSMDAQMTIYVNEKGIIYVNAQNPVEFVSVSDNVELLTLDDVRSIIKEEVTENFGKFRFRYTSQDWLVTFNAMELIYFRVRDKENPGYYSYVPTWRLGDIFRIDAEVATITNNWVLINAIDGSVIDFYDEV